MSCEGNEVSELSRMCLDVIALALSTITSHSTLTAVQCEYGENQGKRWGVREGDLAPETLRTIKSV